MKWFTLLVYNLLMPLVMLLMLPKQWRKMRRRGGYGTRAGERFGKFSPEVRRRLDSFDRPLWIHAVSVGEMLMALRLIAEARRTGVWTRPVVLSTTTSTGRKLAEERADAETQVIWMPLDLPWVARRALKLIRPQALLLVEAEMWPNLTVACRRNAIPVAMANARLSPRSGRRFARFAALVRPIFADLSWVGLQSEADRDRFLAIGVRPEAAVVTGSVKFDSLGEPESGTTTDAEVAALTAALPFLHGMKILLGASTHPGEEEIIARAWLAVRDRHPELALVVVPRHFERAPDAAADFKMLGLQPLMRSDLAEADPGSPLPHPAADCLIVDTTGELAAWTRAASLVVVGKSFPPHHGGQTPAEAARYRKPLVTGPNMENFADLMRMLREQSAVRQLDDAADLAGEIGALLEDPSAAAAMAGRGRAVLAAHDGATRRTLDGLRPFLGASGPSSIRAKT